MEMRFWAFGLVLVAACAVVSTDGELVSIPANKHANLDPISLLEMEERADAKKAAAAAAMEGDFGSSTLAGSWMSFKSLKSLTLPSPLPFTAATAAARMMDRDASKKAADITPAEAKPENFIGGNPHEDQMDDLFGSMRKQQMEDEQSEQRRKEDEASFNVNVPTGNCDALHNNYALLVFPLCIRPPMKSKEHCTYFICSKSTVLKLICCYSVHSGSLGGKRRRLRELVDG